MPELLSRDQLKAEVQAAQQELLAIRRHLHAHPELSGNEHQTAALVAGELRKLGWRVQEGVGRTGVVAELGSGTTPVRPTPSWTLHPSLRSSPATNAAV